MKKQLLIIALVWPEPDSTAAGKRMLQLIHFFLEQGYRITMASTAAESERSLNTSELGISKVSIVLNHASFDEFVSELKPDVVLFDRFLTEEQFGWRVAESAPDAIRILDTEDLHSLRKTRENCFKKNLLFTKDIWMENDITKREISSIYRSDITLIISSYEMYLLNKEIGINEDILHYLPFMIDPISASEMKAFKPFEERSDFIFIGNGKHAPNVDAITWLKTEIWPLIRKELPETKLHIYGAYFPEHIQQMHNPKEGFFLEGWAPTVKEVMESARVNLVPLRFGAGLKGKLVDAICNGTPSATTQIGAEGISDNQEIGGALANSAADFAQAAINLYANKTLWQEVQNNGLQLINQSFSKEKYTALFSSKLNALVQNLQKHRNSNFIGAMLQQQTTLSSKHLSKYIEAKNKNT